VRVGKNPGHHGGSSSVAWPGLREAQFALCCGDCDAAGVLALTPERLSALFNEGERDGPAIVGDRAREAVASLRGYTYQAYATAIEWVELPPDADLHLEVAEDFAVAARDALLAVQVKDQAGTVTLASQTVRAMLDAFVGLVAANPERTVRMALLTTARVGLERERVHRPSGGAGLLRWREVSDGTDPAGIDDLRRALMSLQLAEATREFIRARDDGRLRRELIQRMEWRCGEAPLGDLVGRLEERVAELCADEFDIPPEEGTRVAPHLLLEVLKTSTSPGGRMLRHADLRRVVEAATAVWMPRGAIQAVFRLLAGQNTSGDPGRPTSKDMSEPEAGLPLPRLVVARPALASRMAKMLAESPAAAIHGGTGMGKTLLARLVARQVGSDWRLLDLRGLAPAEAGERLLASARRRGPRARGIIADDLADLWPVDGRSALARAARALADRGELLIITTARPPGRRAREVLGIGEGSILSAPTLTEEEVLALVREAGGSHAWADPVYLASRGGHPQLANALGAGLQARGWPEAERDAFALARGADVLEETELARRRLVEALPDEGARHLLHRISMLAGRFPRSVALAVAGVPPPSRLPGEHFDALVGPWVDQVGADRFRISPLLAGAGGWVLAPHEQVRVHRAAAEAIFGPGPMQADQAANALRHGLQGNAVRVLQRLSAGVVSSRPGEVRLLRRHLTLLANFGLDAPIYPADAHTSLMLRLAQFELVASGGAGPRTADCARAVVREARRDGGRLELGVLSKVLYKRRLPSFLPEWPELLARFQELLGDGPPELEVALAEAPSGSSPASLLFGSAVADLRTVAELASAFARLEAIDPRSRDAMLSPMTGAAAPQHLVARPWLHEREGKALDVTAAAQYGRMAAVALGWRQLEWAVGLYVAQSAVLSEAGGDHGAALDALDAAVAVVGDVARLRLARAKVHYRIGSSAEVVAIVAGLADAFQDNPIERVRMLREGAVSAGRLGQHETSASWFDGAAAEEPRVGGAMAVGLLADAAVAWWRADDRPAALGRLVEVLDGLETLDPASDLQAGYVHRVVRHALLWFGAEAGQLGVLVDGAPPALPPGACSNPDPSPAVVDVALPFLDLAWYSLTQVAYFAGAPERVPDLATRLRGAPILVMEVVLAKIRTDMAIQRLDPEAFVAGLPALSGAAMLMDRVREQATRPLAEWEHGNVPPAGPEAAGAVGRLLHDAVISFGIVAAASGGMDALARLGALLAERDALPPPDANDIRALFGRRAPALVGDRTTAACVPAMAGPADPSGLLEVCLRVALHLERSEFARFAVPPFVRWAKREWARTASGQRFALRTPAVTVPVLTDLAQAEGDTLREVGALLVAAMDAVSMNVPEALRSRVRALAAGRQ